jgi:hypothetical protein
MLAAAPSALVYEPQPFGLPVAQRAVAGEVARRGSSISADRIVLTASTSEAYSVLFKLLCDPGDVVLVPRPSYPLFEHLTRLDDVVAAPYSLEYHGRWTLDVDALAESMPPRTRAVLVVNPNNPTGSFLGVGELAALTWGDVSLLNAEVALSRTYAARIRNLRNGGGLNGSTVLTKSVVTDDGTADSLWGGDGVDWFWGTSTEVKDKDRNSTGTRETIN